MASGGPLRARRATAVVAVALLWLPVAALPARACTRVGGVTIGECRRQPTSGRPKTTKTTPETAILRMLNDERRARGLRPLKPDSRAREMAEQHARRMARRGRIYHNPELSTSEGRRRLGNPSVVGENVGVGPSTGSIHSAFMRSYKHKRNIVHRSYRQVGVGAVWQGGSLWVVEVFLARSGGASAADSGSGSHAVSSGQRAGAEGNRSANGAVSAAAPDISGMPVGTPTVLGSENTTTGSPQPSTTMPAPALLAGLGFLVLGLALMRRTQITRTSA